MSRTLRSVPHYVKDWVNSDWWKDRGHKKQRLVKGTDGCIRHGICGSANETILNNWDELCPRASHRHEVKARVHRQIRRHLNRDLVRRLRED